LALPVIPFDPDEELFPIVRAAQQLRRLNVQPVLVEPDSPAQRLPHRAYYVPAGFVRADAPAAVIVREHLDGDGSIEAQAMLLGGIHHAARQLGITPGGNIIACDEQATPCSVEEETLLRRELGLWWSWWAPRNHRRLVAPVRRAEVARA
jgi:hypothetical protein